MESKIQGLYVDRGFGFPIALLNVPMIKVRGQWTPDIDFNDLTKRVLLFLANLDGRLSGNQVKFIRLHFEMTLEQFGKRFGDVTHAAVKKWENAGDAQTDMSWSHEKDIRLFLIVKLFGAPKRMFSLYAQLEQAAPKRTAKVELCAIDSGAFT